MDILTFREKPILTCVVNNKQVEFDAQGDANEDTHTFYTDLGFEFIHAGYVFYMDGRRNKNCIRTYYYKRGANGKKR